MAEFKLNKEKKVIGGVCAGLADVFGVDPIIPRLAFVFLALWVGGGIALYLILWILMSLNTK
jgi:phage shock protein C